MPANQDLGNTTRFSDRVDNYVRTRPTYPPQVLETVAKKCGLQPSWVIADVGAGTGILAKLLLERGNRVYGVEPNKEMREASVRLLATYPKYTGVDGTAEATTLADGSIDLLTAGQAFHWFNPTKAKVEFERILKRPGWVVLVWNTRDVSEPFQSGYEALLRKHGTDYTDTRHENIESSDMDSFFGKGAWQKRTFPHAQSFDLEGLKGRVLSSSYVPVSGPGRERLIAGVEALFKEQQKSGKVPFAYVTELYWGRLKP